MLHKLQYLLCISDVLNELESHASLLLLLIWEQLQVQFNLKAKGILNSIRTLGWIAIAVS